MNIPPSVLNLFQEPGIIAVKFKICENRPTSKNPNHTGSGLTTLKSATTKDI